MIENRLWEVSFTKIIGYFLPLWHWHLGSHSWLRKWHLLNLRQLLLQHLILRLSFLIKRLSWVLLLITGYKFSVLRWLRPWHLLLESRRHESLRILIELPRRGRSLHVKLPWISHLWRSLLHSLEPWLSHLANQIRTTHLN